MADPVTALVPNFLQHGRYLRGWSPKTVLCYSQALAGFTVEQINKPSLQRYILSLQEQGHSPGGINVKIRTLNSFLTWLHEEEYATLPWRRCKTPKLASFSKTTQAANIKF